MEQTTVGVNEFRYIHISQTDISTHRLGFLATTIGTFANRASFAWEQLCWSFSQTAVTDVFEALLTDHCVAAPWLFDMAQVRRRDARKYKVRKC